MRSVVVSLLLLAPVVLGQEPKAVPPKHHRVARTIADLEGAPGLTGNHLAEAIGYRTLDRKLWQR